MNIPSPLDLFLNLGHQLINIDSTNDLNDLDKFKIIFNGSVVKNLNLTFHISVICARRQAGLHSTNSCPNNSIKASPLATITTQIYLHGNNYFWQTLEEIIIECSLGTFLKTWIDTNWGTGGNVYINKPACLLTPPERVLLDRGYSKRAT